MGPGAFSRERSRAKIGKKITFPLSKVRKVVHALSSPPRLCFVMSRRQMAQKANLQLFGFFFVIWAFHHPPFLSSSLLAHKSPYSFTCLFFLSQSASRTQWSPSVSSACVRRLAVWRGGWGVYRPRVAGAVASPCL